MKISFQIYLKNLFMLKRNCQANFQKFILFATKSIANIVIASNSYLENKTTEITNTFKGHNCHMWSEIKNNYKFVFYQNSFNTFWPLSEQSKWLLRIFQRAITLVNLVRFSKFLQFWVCLIKTFNCFVFLNHFLP